ncbi:hypothetical protein Leryth_011270 [Lithospermum erythrorhizon]|uniref:Aquaporin NIP-type n=1 Tax=Lithospermum erythrorhizon TaxID=34254 RepID=A0AAV3RWT3_LITER|nr:hypothetical protein Leryth_011270 [Lithospermum erythrorhizon]
MSSKDFTIEAGNVPTFDKSSGDDNDNFWSYSNLVQVTQKMIAEVIGTYFLVLVGCGSVVVNKINEGSITFPGICVAFGLIIMIMIYSLGHISGAHFNPAVTIAFSLFRHFPYQQVPLYILSQLIGAIFASGTLYLLIDEKIDAFFGTVPTGSNLQSLVMEFIVSYLLMFVISGVATDSRSIGEMAGIAIGMTILLGVMVAGSISGGSMNPARSIGPAIVMLKFKGLWVYIVGPIMGTIAGGFTYNLIRFTEKPLSQLTKEGSLFIKTYSRKPSCG